MIPHSYTGYMRCATVDHKNVALFPVCFMVTKIASTLRAVRWSFESEILNRVQLKLAKLPYLHCRIKYSKNCTEKYVFSQSTTRIAFLLLGGKDTQRGPYLFLNFSLRLVLKIVTHLAIYGLFGTRFKWPQCLALDMHSLVKVRFQILL